MDDEFGQRMMGYGVFDGMANNYVMECPLVAHKVTPGGDRDKMPFLSKKLRQESKLKM